MGKYKLNYKLLEESNIPLEKKYKSLVLRDYRILISF
jgi:hypothetical protein